MIGASIGMYLFRRLLRRPTSPPPIDPQAYLDEDVVASRIGAVAPSGPAGPAADEDRRCRLADRPGRTRSYSHRQKRPDRGRLYRDTVLAFSGLAAVLLLAVVILPGLLAPNGGQVLSATGTPDASVGIVTRPADAVAGTIQGAGRRGRPPPRHSPQRPRSSRSRRRRPRPSPRPSPRRGRHLDRPPGRRPGRRRPRHPFRPRSPTPKPTAKTDTEPTPKPTPTPAPPVAAFTWAEQRPRGLLRWLGLLARNGVLLELRGWRRRDWRLTDAYLWSAEPGKYQVTLQPSPDLGRLRSSHKDGDGPMNRYARRVCSRPRCKPR